MTIMPLDYEQAKKFFNDKLTNDLEGKGRVESALYHTAMWIYEQGYKDNDSAKDARIAELVGAIEAMRVAGGSYEFHRQFEKAKQLIQND